MVRCGACGQENPENAVYCNQCGKSISGTRGNEECKVSPKEETYSFRWPFYTITYSKRQIKFLFIFPIIIGIFGAIMLFWIGEFLGGMAILMIAVAFLVVSYFMATEL